MEPSVLNLIIFLVYVVVVAVVVVVNQLLTESLGDVDGFDLLVLYVIYVDYFFLVLV